MNTDGKDHDLLVTVNVKLDTLTRKVDDMSDGMTERLTALEKFKDEIEQRIARYPAETLVPRFEVLERAFHDQQLTAKERLRISALTSSIVTFILTTAMAIIGIVSGIIKLNG